MALRRPSGNRRLKQKRPLGARLPELRAAAWRGLRRATRALVGLAAAAAIAAAGWLGYRWLVTSPRFALREIVVDGNAHLPREAVLRRAAVREGQNLFTLSPRRIQAALAREPWIAEVEARRRLPDRLEIHVVERQPAALVQVGGAGLYLADAGGRPFKLAAVDAGEGAGLIVVSGLPRDLYTDGGDRAAALVARALAVAALWAHPGRPPLGEVHLGRDGITLRTLEGGVAVVLGRGADAELAAAMRRFDAIWAALPPDERALARRIHLDSRTRPDRVTVSLAEPERKP